MIYKIEGNQTQTFFVYDNDSYMGYVSIQSRTSREETENRVLKHLYRMAEILTEHRLSVFPGYKLGPSVNLRRPYA